MLPNDPFNLIIAGVGGQGNVLASKIIASVANSYGYNVTVGDTFGVSQRGGAVMSHVRLAGKATYGPLIPKHAADVIMGFEPMETLRVLQNYGKANTKVLTNDRPVYPLGVQRGEDYYAADKIWEKISSLAAECKVVEAARIAEELGNPKIINMIMVGALISSKYLPFAAGEFEKIIKHTFPEELVELNLNAFRASMIKESAATGENIIY